jgi:hypothetical protein
MRVKKYINIDDAGTSSMDVVGGYRG